MLTFGEFAGTLTHCNNPLKSEHTHMNAPDRQPVKTFAFTEFVTLAFSESSVFELAAT